MSEIFVHYLAIVITASLILYCIGYLFFQLLRFQPKGVFTSVFLKLFLGCFSFTAICALYFTSLKTIFTGLIISLIFFSYGVRKHVKNRSRQHTDFKCEFLVLILFLVILSSIYTYRFYSITYNGDIPNLPNPDFTFYARISHFLVESGIESATPTFVYPQLNSRDPYHYFDLWFCGGISYFLGGNNLQILFLVTYTIGIGLVSIGFCSLAETLNKLSAISVLFAVLGTFFIPLPTFFSEALNSLLNKFFLLIHAPPGYIDYGLWNMTKMYPVYLILITSILAFLKGEKAIGIAILSTLVFIYTTICIPILLALSMFVLFDYFFKTREKKFFIYSSVFLLSIYLFLFVFYLPYLSDPGGNGLDPLRRLGTEPLYKTILRPAKIFFDASLQLLILLAPFILLLILDIAKSNSLKSIPQIIHKSIRKNEYAYLAIILYVTALSSWALLSAVNDANQFFATSAIPLVNIFCFIVVISLRETYSKILVIILGIHFINVTTTGIFEQRLYSESYMRELRDITKRGGRIYGFLLSREDYEDGYGYNIVDALGEYITLFRPDQYLVNLSITDLPLSAEKMEFDTAQVELSKYDFYQFIQGQKRINKFVSIPHSRVDFIDKFHIDYVIASPRVELDSILEKQVARKIIDDYSKQVFLVLK